ncbi:RluA family pseudouridine synthase [Amaricoccus solimangrovi]|uniref:Pseudouridine synthase n=1 Tax=Amaricoccus solimangrovi TaxID=2589815 RepID=A0A501WR11_9RHOB|nr:RluA family pseudouridine synthase [Amaricoccus solimangrovi]TPE52213.1 RluA family pseudouridine synthase [Amaricoccus solimangrovi]
MTLPPPSSRIPPPREIRVALAAGPESRLDKALAAAVPEGLGLSRSRLQALIAEGAVARADGVVVSDPKARVAGGEFTLTLPAPIPAAAQPEDIPLEIVYEDAHLIVLDKPVGLVVHPAPGQRDGTLVNALLHHSGGSLSGIGGEIRPGIVHRIDKETSGLLVVAKDDAAHQGLAAQFKAHDLERRYLAVVRGAPDPADPRLRGLAGISWEPGGVLRIEGAIGRHPGDRKRMAVLSRDGRRAVTRARVLERFGPPGAPPVASLVECWLETGRTHQIRVHMTFAGHPLIGDRVYGKRVGVEAGFPRQALHARTLGFVHPVTGEAMRFEAPPPGDFRDLVDRLRRLGHADV